jgi:pyruvate-formate lyase-activating enzyme
VTTRKTIRRKLLAAHRKVREIRMIVKGLASKRHPLLAHIIPTRRCNLACTYCNEFDDVSNPVPTEEMFQRIDRLGAMGTAIVTISGGEPLLHPDLDAIIARIRKNGMMAGLITNGYLLVADRIQRLNRAGLEYLQISIDNVMPDDVSKKSLKVLDQKLALLAEHADFHVNINSVLGSGVRNPEDALTVAHRAIELGFTSTVGILHDHNGQLEPLGPREQEISTQHRARERKRLALPRRLALSLHLRRRFGPLLLATARIPRHPANAIHGRAAPPRVFHKKRLCPALHGVLRAPSCRHRFLAFAPNLRFRVLREYSFGTPGPTHDLFHPGIAPGEHLRKKYLQHSPLNFPRVSAEFSCRRFTHKQLRT